MSALMRIEIKKINKGSDFGPRFGNLSVNWVKIPKTATPTVNMSREGDGCPTSITSLSSHNEHAPIFEDEADLDDYLDRVMAAVDAAMTAWVDGVYDGPTVEETPATFTTYVKGKEVLESSYGGTKVVYTAAELGIPPSYDGSTWKVPKTPKTPKLLAQVHDEAVFDIINDVDEYRRRDNGKWELVVPTETPSPTKASDYGPWQFGWNEDYSDYLHPEYQIRKHDICSICGETWLVGHSGFNCI